MKKRITFKKILREVEGARYCTDKEWEIVEKKVELPTEDWCPPFRMTRAIMLSGEVILSQWYLEDESFGLPPTYALLYLKDEKVTIHKYILGALDELGINL